MGLDLMGGGGLLNFFSKLAASEVTGVSRLDASDWLTALVVDAVFVTGVGRVLGKGDACESGEEGRLLIRLLGGWSAEASRTGLGVMFRLEGMLGALTWIALPVTEGVRCLVTFSTSSGVSGVAEAELVDRLLLKLDSSFFLAILAVMNFGGACDTDEVDFMRTIVPSLLANVSAALSAPVSVGEGSVTTTDGSGSAVGL